ncbi:MAG: TonB-dependent receptor [Prevotella sp.]|nr:TonB-dependent receptor [Prevotella sp.]
MWTFKNLQKPLVFLFLLCLFPMGALAQSKVSGTVNDEAGDPIIGATVRVQGTNEGSVTDMNGRFSVSARSNAVLSVSYVGYKTENVNVGGRSNIVIVLKEDNATLDDVVVVGYGTMKKSDISGSVATVDQEAVMKRIPTNIGQALQGAAAGVMVTQYDGTPDGDAAIRIRGVGTINGDASPLYVVDGVQVGNSASFVNPSDIERIEILKDASATAIYGSAGANGVVMITTKHGSKGRTNINVTADFGLQTLPYTLDVLDLGTFAKALREAKITNQKDGIGNQIWNEKYDGRLNEIDWQKEMTRAALRQQYGASINGGNEKTQFNMSFGFLDVDGLVVNTNYQRFTARANISSKVNKYLEIGGDINFTHSESHGSNMGLGNNQNMSSLRDFASMTPTLDYVNNNDPNGSLVNVNLKNPDGSYGATYQNTPNAWEGNTNIATNPYASQMENGERARNGFDRIQTTAFIDLTFLENEHHKLDVRSQGTYTYWGNNSSDYTGGRHRFNYIDGVLTEIPLNADQTYSFSLNNSHGYSLGIQTYLTYNLNYDIHNLTLMVGNEVGKSWGQWVSAGARSFPSVMNRSIALTEDLNSRSGNGAYNADTHTISYFARATYSLMDRYIITGTIRKDGSSNFGAGNRWGTFPSVAGAWRISEEPFMKDITFVDNLKFRVGWGQTGNAGGVAGKGVAALSGDAAYKFYPNGGSAGYWGNGVRETGWFAPLVDTNLKWETTEMTNFGIDFAFLGNWDVTLDYFIKNTKDLLLYQQIRQSAGNTQIYTNYGEIQNKGFEFAIGYHKQVNKDFAWNARLTGSTISNKVKKMGDPLYNTCSDNGTTIDGHQVGAVDGASEFWTNHSICMEGEAVGSYFGYVFDGIIKDEADLNDYKNRIKSDDYSKCDDNHPLSVGDAKFKDLDGNGLLDQNDRTIIGNGFPTLNYGLNLGATYKDWDFSLYMYGVFGQDILSYSAMKLSSMVQLDDQCIPNILNDAYSDAFRNGSGTLPRLTVLDPNRNARVSDLWIKNGDFLRISNLQVGYTLPSSISNKLAIQKARVYLGVNNLLTISGYNKYGDPEIGTGSVLYTGLDTGRYPMPRTFMAGINVTF